MQAADSGQGRTAERMNRLAARVLEAIVDLERTQPGVEADEYQLARALDLIPATMPPHAYTKSPLRARFLRTLAALEQQRFVYVTTNGFWRLHLTAAGRVWLATAPTVPDEPALPVSAPAPIVSLAPVAHPSQTVAVAVAWEGPRRSPIPTRPPHDRFTTLTLGLATCVAIAIFAFSTIVREPLTQRAAAKPAPPLADSPAPVAATTVPIAPTVAPAPTPTTPVKRFFIVANTGGAGVYIRRSPQLADRLAAWPDTTRLEEIGPETVVDGITWRHVRAPNGATGYVPAQYTAPAP